MGGLFSRARGSLPRARTPADALGLALIVVSSLLALKTAWWFGHHAWAIYRLTRGVGDTMFYSADGRPWFPLDEHRRDVGLDQIAPNLRNAVVAVEDHRFRRHVGLDPV